MKQWVKDGVAEVAREVLQERGSGNHAGFPLIVSMEVRKRRPDIWKHLSRYGKMDPHQYCSMYIPKGVSDELTGKAGEL